MRDLLAFPDAKTCRDLSVIEDYSPLKVWRAYRPLYGLQRPTITINLCSLLRPLRAFLYTDMALRNPISQLCKHVSRSSISRASAISPQHVCSQHLAPQRRSMATVVPPVTQDATSSKGPTAMVFMNMGGPSTTDEVGVFLSRLFVSGCSPLRERYSHSHQASLY
jgi:hypothetical protein